MIIVVINTYLEVIILMVNIKQSVEGVVVLPREVGTSMYKILEAVVVKTMAIDNVIGRSSGIEPETKIIPSKTR
jgi:hypothetical protein